MNKQITIKDLLEICGAELIQGDEELRIQSVNTDTRKIEKGDIFFGIEKGNEYIEKAIKSGVSGCVVEYIDQKVLDRYPNTTIVKVNNSIKALQELATYKRSLYNIPVIAVTGSVGKTSTKDIIAEVVGKKYKTLKTEGNYNNHIGLPITILKLENHEAMVVEMGMNHFNEISLLTKIANPTIAVITNVGTSHIGNLGSRENILKAKLEILEGIKEGGRIVINNDNDLLNNWNKQSKLAITYGIENDSDYVATQVEILSDSSKYKINIENQTYNVIVPISGTHFVYNSLCAIAVGKSLGIETNAIIDGIKEFNLTKNRMEVQKINGTKVINDSYNASFESMKYALEYLKNIEGNKKIAVLGDMLELGEFSKELHEKVGKEIETYNVDVLITVGKEAENIYNVANTIVEKYKLKTNEEAIKTLKKIISKDDVVLLKASNGMKFGEILNGLRA